MRQEDSGKGYKKHRTQYIKGHKNEEQKEMEKEIKAKGNLEQNND